MPIDFIEVLLLASGMMERNTMLRQQAVIKNKENVCCLHNFFSYSQHFIHTKNYLDKRVVMVVMETFVCQELKSEAIPLLVSMVSLHAISHLFGVSKASVCLITKVHCALWWCIEASGGWMWQTNTIDGTHIPIILPQELVPSRLLQLIILQGLVDHNGLFIYVGHLRRLARTSPWRKSNSSLFKKGPHNDRDDLEIPLVWNSTRHFSVSSRLTTALVERRARVGLEWLLSIPMCWACRSMEMFNEHNTVSACCVLTTFGISRHLTQYELDISGNQIRRQNIF